MKEDEEKRLYSHCREEPDFFCVIRKRSVALTNRSAAWESEKRALKMLEKNFVNEPEIEHYPFTRLIDTDEEKMEVKMSHCGVDLGCGKIGSKRINVISTDKLQNDQARQLDINSPNKPKNVKNTIECIINNLVINDIWYPDSHYANLCVNKKGHLHLIDFEEAWMPPWSGGLGKEGSFRYSHLRQLGSNISLAFGP